MNIAKKSQNEQNGANYGKWKPSIVVKIRACIVHASITYPALFYDQKSWLFFH